MTSLIFGSIYMTHQGIVQHRRSKQREKNYRRWEDLRDDYDEQKKITRETRSLDIQRTGSMGEQGYFDPEYTAREERPILTLRDQQEANDARMSWRPQESWEPSHQKSNNPFQSPMPQRSVTLPSLVPPQQTSTPPPSQSTPQLHHATTTPSAYWQNRGEIRPQKTGATWDDGLPPPLRVSRRSFDDYDYPRQHGSSRSVQTPRQSQLSQTESLSRQDSRQSTNPPSRDDSPAPIQCQFVPSYNPSGTTHDDLVAKLANISVAPVQSYAPGGPMAELIERGY